VLTLHSETTTDKAAIMLWILPQHYNKLNWQQGSLIKTMYVCLKMMESMGHSFTVQQKF
jgi:hypothetical protein